MKIGKAEHLYYRVEVDGDYVLGNYDDVYHYLKNLDKNKKCSIFPGITTKKKNGKLRWSKIFCHPFYEQQDKSVGHALNYFRPYEITKNGLKKKHL
eukprot:SAG11_NODE_15220_length_584_cov_33.635052_1_plen_96_part_00